MFECTASGSDGIFLHNTREDGVSTLNIDSDVEISFKPGVNSAIHAYGEVGTAVVNMNAGDICAKGEGQQVSAVIVDQNAAFNMKGGTFDLSVDFDTFSQNNDVVGVLVWGQNGVQKNGAVKIEGGLFNVGGKNAFAQAIQVGMKNGKSENISVEISGGEIVLSPSGDGEGYVFTPYNAAYASATMSGGRIRGTVTALTATASGTDTANMTVSGGTFPFEVKESYCADGFTVKATTDADGNTVYGVVEEVVAATIGGTAYETLDEAIKAVQDGGTIVVNAGEYKLNGSLAYTGKAFTIQAAEGAKVSFDMSGAVALHGAKITFTGVTFDYKTNGNYIGLQHTDTLVYNDCTINGMVFLYAASETFNRCTFNQTDAGAYNVWTYGAKEVAFNACTFNCVGKAVLVYNEGANTKTDLAVSDCDFKASAPVEGKAAIEIDTSLMAGATITVDTKTTAEGFAEGSNSKSTLWNDKKQTQDTNKNTTVTVAGETVFTPNVAQVGTTGYTTLAAALASLSAENHTLTLLNEDAWDAATPVYWAAGTQNGYAATFADALTAAYKVNAGAITVVCRPGADVGKMTHGHVADDLTVYGNNAYLSDGECDLEIDTFQYSRETGKQVASGGVSLDKDITITAYELDNLGVWGQRTTDHTVTVNLTDCDGKALEGKENVQRVYISGTTGVNNITLTGCDFLTEKTAVYSNADGAITVKDCSFTGGAAPVNVNHKADGAVSVTVEGCTFTNCGDDGDWKQFAAPIRFVNSGAGTMSASVATTTITGTVGTNGDILLGDGRTGQKSNDVALTVTDTAANVQAQKPGYYDGETVDETKTATAASPASGTLETSVAKLLPNSVAQVGEEKYTTLAEAVAAAQVGDTVTLLDDTVVANVVLGKSLTLDLNGKTVSSKSGAKVLTVTAGTVTVKNGTVQAGTVVNGGSRDSNPAIYVTVGQSATEKEITLTLENMTVLGIENQKRGVTAETVADLVAGGMCKYDVTAGTAVKISSQYDTAITVNVKNSTIRGGKGAATEGTVTDYLSGGANQAYGGVGIYAKGENLTLNIMEGSKVFGGDSDNKDAGKALELQKCVSVVISDSTVQGGNGYGIAGSAVYSSTVVTAVTVVNSTLKGGDAQTSWNGAGIELTRESPTITIRDSTVIGGQGPGNAKDPHGYAIDSNSATTTDKITLEGDVTLKANENTTVVRKTVLGDPGFTLKDATVTVAGGTLENVTVAVAEGSSQAEIRTSGETATVDVETVVSSDDTKTLSDNGNGTFTFEACVARVTAADGASRGYLTFTDALAAVKTGGTVTLLADVTETDTLNVGNVYDITGVTLDLNGHTYSQNNFAHVFQGTGGVIKNGKMVCLNGGSYALFIGNDPDKTTGFTVEDVELTGGINIYNASGVVLRNLTVNGSGYYAVWMDNVASATIESGTYTAGAGGVLNGAESSTLAVSGGVFKTNGKPLMGTEGGTLQISGGQFDTAVDEAYCAEGFIPTKNADGTYGVKKGTYVAQVGTTKYETVDAAMEAAAANETATMVKLIAESTDTTLVPTWFIKNDVTIDADSAVTATFAPVENAVDAPDTDGMAYLASFDTECVRTVTIGENVTLVFPNTATKNVALYFGYGSDGNWAPMNVVLDGHIEAYLPYLCAQSTMTISKTGSLKALSENLITRWGSTMTVTGTDGAWTATNPQVSLGYASQQGGEVTFKDTFVKAGAWWEMWNRNGRDDYATKLTLDNTSFVAGEFKGKKADGATSAYEVELKNGSKMTISGNFGIIAEGTVTVEAGSLITAKSISNAGTLVVVATGITAPIKVFDYTGTTEMTLADYGTVNVVGGEAYVADNDLWVKKPSVAAIGEVKYETLQAAFDAAQTGDTVTLLSDITLTEQVNITKALDGLTLDGNGKTITCATTTDPFQGGGSALYFGNANDHLYCTGIKIKDLTMTGMARFAIFLCGGTTTEFTNVKISGNYYIAINLYGTHGATLTDCDISNSTTGTDKYISAIRSNVSSANPLTLNNSKVDVIAINAYTTANKLEPKIFVMDGSEVGEIHTFDDGSVSGNKKLCVSTESTGSYVVKEYDEATQTWVDIRVVAAIGDIGYETLEAAFAAAKDGDTVTVLADSNGDGIVVKANTFKTGLTVDFAGHTYTVGGLLVGSSGTASNGFQLNAGNKITFKNGTIVGATATAGAGTDWKGAPAILIQNYCDLTLEKMTVKGGDETCYTLSNNNGEIVIDGSTIVAGKGTKYGPFAFDVCRYSSYPSVHVTVKGASVIEGDVEISGTVADNQSRQLDIEDGEFKGEFKVVDLPANISISGGTFSDAVLPEYCASGYIPTANDDGTYGVKQGTYVAQIGTTGYETLEAALAAADAGATVKMLANVVLTAQQTIAKVLVLDLNGKAISSTVDQFIVIAKGGDLTVNDATGEGRIENTTAEFWGGTILMTGGVLTLNGGTLAANTATGEYSPVIEAKSSATINVAGGRIEANRTGRVNAIQLGQNADATLNVTGGTIFGGTSGVYSYQRTGTVSVGNVVNVSGGEIIGKSGNAVYAAAKTGLSISGGTLTPGGSAAAIGIGGGDCTVTIGREGGVVDDVTIPSIDFGNRTATVNLLSGKVGMFKNWTSMTVERVSLGKDKLLVGTDISARLPDSKLRCQLVDAESGLYEIVELTVENAAAVILHEDGTETLYHTVEQAVLAVTDGDTLTLKVDHTGALALSAKNVTVDLGGNTLKFSDWGGSALSFNQSTASDNTVTVKNGTIVATGQGAACVRAEMKGDLSKTLTVVFGADLTLTSGSGSRYGAVLLHEGARTASPCASMTKGGLLVTESEKQWIYGETATAFTHANGTEVTLLNDWYCTDYEGTVKVPDTSAFGSAKLNLDGHTIQHYGAGAAIVMGNDAKPDEGTADKTLEISNGTIETSRHGAAVCGSNKSLTLDGVTLTTTGDKMFGLYANGMTTGNTVTLKKGSAVVSEKATGIYFPGAGTLTVEDSNVTGDMSGIEVRAGVLNVSGTSVIESTATAFGFTNDNNGITTTGAAVAAVKHTVGNDLTVTITGGTFKGPYGFYANDPNTATGGTLSGEISGGTFSARDIPADDLAQYLVGYLADGCKTVQQTIDGTLYYVVGPAITQIEVSLGDVKKLLPFADAWLADKIGTDASGWTTAALEADAANGLKKWQCYLFGLNPSDATAKIVVTAKQGTVESIPLTVANADASASPLVTDGYVTVTYVLMGSDDGTAWTAQVAEAATPDGLAIPLAGTVYKFYRVDVKVTSAESAEGN